MNEESWSSSDWQNPIAAFVLDQMVRPVILFDAELSPCYRNTSARRWLSSYPVLTLIDSRIVLSDPTDQTQFRQAAKRAVLGQSTWMNFSSAPEAGIAAVGSIPLLDGAARVNEGLLYLCVGGLGQTLERTVAQHAVHVSLSKAETRVYHRFCEGLQPKQIARSLCVSQETVRSHLRSIRTKAGAKSLRDLIGMAATLPWG